MIVFLALLFADVRIYPFTYPFVTTPSGDVELEFYYTVKDKKPDEAIDAIEQWLEVEYGITDRLDISFYQMWSSDINNNLKNSGNKVRFRYKLAEKNRFILDPLLYLEYKFLPGKADETEYKLILAKDAGRFNFSYNYILELSHKDVVGKWENEHFLGVSYALNHTLRVLVENLYVSAHEGKSEADYIGGGMNYISSGGKFWFSAGIYRGITDASEHTRARLLIGIPL